MSITLELGKMTLSEKLETMELIWDDLCHNNTEMIPPNWHKTILEEREKRVLEGKELILDWDIAKKNLRESLQ